MPREPRVVVIGPEEYERQKAEVAARCQRFLVTGDSKIADSIDRDGPSRVKGEYVMLDPEVIVIKLLTANGLVKAAPLEAEPVKAKAKQDA
jgi:hypothetical protein